MANDVTRRDFLSDSSKLAAGSIAAVGLQQASAVASTDQPVEIALIGCGGIMNHHARGFAKRKSNVHFRWLCDVDPKQIDSIDGHLDGFQTDAIKRATRYEDVLEDKNVEAVVIATPHHWHVPIAIAAMQAGKDVYVEKPISHVFSEGPLMIKAARKYGRIVQHGTQMRSSPVKVEAEKLLKQGIIGEVKIARAWTAEVREVQKAVPDSDPPNNVDYDRWLGPAPKRPFNKTRFHRTWRVFRDYANGEIGDDGIHDIDMAVWGLGEKYMPKQITARGGIMKLHGHVSEYPDNMNVTYEYEDGKLLIYENYPFTSYGLHGFDNGNVFYGTEGYMVFSRRGAFSVYLGPKSKPGPTESPEIRGNAGRGCDEHMENFLECIRTRKPANARPEIGHSSSGLIHLGDIAYQTGQVLNFDGRKSRFTNNDAANDMLTKNYRKPYQLPEV